MALLSTTDIAELTALDEAAMTATATIRRYISVSDGSGGTTDTYSNVGTYPCRINVLRLQPTDRTIAGEILNVSNFSIHLPLGTDVRNKDQILVGSRTFEVDKALNHTWQTSLRVTVAELT